ncbi:MAG: methyltransferase domain-containing protein [Alphaproteobacteria bacterium]|nr:methyltransferase domain-containing protein [Alphaproteobacteria bacterium]MBV9692669.1 methyltransferase domain-containing protein [Alphaproteobacteria bacterium]
MTAALDELREAARLHPNDAARALRHGEALLDAEHLPQAIAEFQRALRLDHENVPARLALGRAWLAAGEPDKALEQFRRLGGVDDEIARAEAMRAQARSDAGYVRHLFDQFAADYDARMLSELGYRAPAILRELMALVAPLRSRLEILDLGCGTGLSGQAFRPLARRLDGIDLSPAMIDKARRRGVYDDLRVGDIERIAGEGVYDQLLAADTLVYLGDLATMFAGAARLLRSDGLFLFTVESHSGEGFALGPKRRWRHAESYLRGAAAEAGFAVSGFLACVPRHEGGQPVEGFAVALEKRCA